MKRMSRGGKGVTSAGLNLVSLMDVFTILVFFLLVNSSSSDVMEPPKRIKLPDSIVEAKPRETVIVMITPQEVLVQGEPVITTQEVIDSKAAIIEQVKERLLLQQKKVIGISTKTVAQSKEVTVLAHRTVPFHLMKKVMASCTSAGYGKISLAVVQKAKSKG
ncbi:MAG: biopolymer transporter ExbD [Gammaproteobacteria bacterium]|nr:biopolymer transporter ExbD [Gammaproteobacteria bacterium]MBT8135241.1 biopolymer transporter ExbD [Gammaproteobacteria bacterium]NNJ51530.1 biopolymer transporter ExbD [Gammaproteobacteria bacterium]